ncbi:ClbS/DfsB family four-helix bundle protein [Lentibacter sp.]|uniref:ClbS/DfsB family four-helix bundle protein n=1 Tax=Lentibacter sp. TaxID=2024994 RepID=UPI003F69DD7B
MRVAHTKVDLLTVLQSEWGKLLAQLERVSEGLAESVDAEGGSIKDVVAHGAMAIGLVLGWYADGQAGREGPPQIHRARDLAFDPSTLRVWQQDLSWLETRALLGAAHEQLVGLVEGLDEAALYGGPMKGVRNSWSTGRWAEAAGAGHYRSTRRYVRRRQNGL